MNERNVGMDVLKILCAFLVVQLHVAAQGFYVIQPFWKTALVYNVIGRISVPTFFMISGAFLLPREQSIAALGKRAMKRIVIPYVLWCIVYLVYISLSTGQPASINNPFLQSPYYHLPFLLQLLSFYLTIPVLGNCGNGGGYWRHAGETSKKYAIATCLLSGGVLEFFALVTGSRLLGFSISFFPYYVGMGMCGAYFYERTSNRIPSVFWLMGYLLCSAGTIYLTYMDSFRIGRASERFLVYQSPFTILGAICVFRLFGQLDFDVSIPIRKHIAALAETTFGVYLFHPLILDLLSKDFWVSQIRWNTFSPISWIPVYSASVFMFCACVVWMCKKLFRVFKSLVKVDRN